MKKTTQTGFFLAALLFSAPTASGLQAVPPPGTLIKDLGRAPLFDGRRPQASLPLLLATENNGPLQGRPAVDPLVEALLKIHRKNTAAPIWPGYRIFDQPIVLYAKDGNAYLFAHPSPPPGFRRLFSRPVSVFRRDDTEAPFTGPFVFHLDFAGQDTFAYPGGGGGGVMSNAATLVHERFHIFQERGFAPRKHGGSRYPGTDPEDLTLANLEHKALLDALEAPGPRVSRLYSRMFVAVRLYRRRKFGPNIAILEDAQERNEGTAEYVNLRLAGSRSHVPRGLKELQDRLRGKVSLNEMGKWRYYITGAAQGYLLDRAGAAGWKGQVASGETVFEAMRAAYPVEGVLKSLVRNARRFPGYEELLSWARMSIGKSLQEKRAAMEAFFAAPGFLFSIPPTGATGGFSADGKIFVLDDGAWLVPGLKQYDKKGPGLAITLANVPVLMRGVTFHLPVDASIELNGAPLVPAEGARDFTSLRIEAAGISISAERPGTLRREGMRLSVTWR